MHTVLHVGREGSTQCLPRLLMANANSSPVYLLHPVLLPATTCTLRFMDFADPALTLLHCVPLFFLNRPHTLLLRCKGGALSTAPNSYFSSLSLCFSVTLTLCQDGCSAASLLLAYWLLQRHRDPHRASRSLSFSLPVVIKLNFSSPPVKLKHNPEGSIWKRWAICYSCERLCLFRPSSSSGKQATVNSPIRTNTQITIQCIFLTVQD